MAIARWATARAEGGGGGTSSGNSRRATYTKPTFKPQNNLNNYSSQYSSNWANKQMYPIQTQNKPNIPGVPQKLANQTTTHMNQGIVNNQGVDRWATAPTLPTYQNNYADMIKKQQQQAAYDKWITRNRELRTDVSGAPRVTQNGYYYFLPGGGYMPQPPTSQPQTNNNGSGNSYAGYGGYGGYGGNYGGGGGGGGYTPTPEWYLSMTTWKI